MHRRRALADPVKTRDRVKTDRRDGASLAKLHRVGELTAVWVPNVGHEAMRDLVRARLDAVYSLRRAHQQLSGFWCVRNATMAGRPGPSCIVAGWRISRSNTGVQHIVLED
jgi:transposase